MNKISQSGRRIRRRVTSQFDFVLPSPPRRPIRYPKKLDLDVVSFGDTISV